MDTADTIEPADVAELVVIPPRDALAIFSTERKPGEEHPIDKILTNLRSVIDSFEADVSTDEGRAAMRTFARRIASAKNRIEEVGKDLAAEQKAIPKRIDATRKHVKDTLDQWRDEVRAPLTAWEAAEEERVAKIKTRLEWLKDFQAVTPDSFGGLSSKHASDLLKDVEAMEVSEAAFAEYAEAATELKTIAMAHLADVVERVHKREAEAAELEALRKDAEERKRIEEEADLKAAEEARVKAAEQAAIEKERAAATAREAALIAEKEAAEKAAAETEARVKREAEEEAERQRVEDAKRAADIEHRRKINAAAVKALVEGGVEFDAARTAVVLIVEGKIPSVTIRY